MGDPTTDLTIKMAWINLIIYPTTNLTIIIASVNSINAITIIIGATIVVALITVN